MDMDRQKEEALIGFLKNEYLTGYRADDLDGLAALYLAVLSAPIGPDELNQACEETLTAYLALMEPEEGMKSKLEICRGLQNSEPVFRKLLYLVNPQRYYAIRNQRKGFSAVLSALGLDSKAALPYAPQVTRTYKLRKDAAHGTAAKQAAIFDLLSNFENIMVSIILAVDLNQEGLMKRLAQWDGTEETHASVSESEATELEDMQESAKAPEGIEENRSAEETGETELDSRNAFTEQEITGKAVTSEGKTAESQSAAAFKNTEDNTLFDEKTAAAQIAKETENRETDSEKRWKESAQGKTAQEAETAAKPHAAAKWNFVPVPPELEGVVRLANGGDPVSQYRLSIYYFSTHEASEGMFYLMKAAEAQLPDALFLLGYMYESGHQTEKNYKKALERYEKAAEYGSPEAIYRLGKMYARGIGTKRDRKKGQALILRAAISGCQKAQWTLARRNESLGDLKEAGKWYEMAARQGGDAEKLWLGKWFAKQGAREKAIAWLKTGIDAQTPDICQKAGAALAKLGAAEQAEACFRKAAEQSPKSALCYAERLYAGQGIRREPDEALEWYQLAAEGGNIHAHAVFRAILRKRNFEGTSLPQAADGTPKGARAAVSVTSSQATASQFFTIAGHKPIFQMPEQKKRKGGKKGKEKNESAGAQVKRMLAEWFQPDKQSGDEKH